MQILFICNNPVAGSLAHTLTREGNDVKMCITHAPNKHDFDGIIPKTNNWEHQLSWVGKNGLIIFDDVGFGTKQDKLRKQGYTVYGGGLEGERLEVDRDFCAEMFESIGLNAMQLKNFDSPEEAYNYVKKHPAKWVIKQNNQTKKSLNYVGELENGYDVLSTLERYASHSYSWGEKISLQKRVEGVEIGVGRYFNGNNWVGPIEMNFEHPRLLAGDIGPMTSEMGTLAWYTANEGRIYNEAVRPFEDYLRTHKFIGDFDINCVVNESGIYPLEATTRFGSPIIHLQQEIHKSPWTDFLYQSALGNDYNLKWREGYGIVVLIVIPEFPFNKNNDTIYEHPEVFFNNCTEEDMTHIHFEGLKQTTNKSGKKHYVVSDDAGYVLAVTSLGKTIEEAQKKAYKIVDKVVVAKKMYRNDIGNKARDSDIKKLLKWGYLSKKDLPFKGTAA